MSREYSYPNDDKLPVIFYEAELDDDNYLIKTEPIEELKEPLINKNLIMYENIECWTNPLTIEKIFDNLFLDENNRDIIAYFMKLYHNFNLYPLLRNKILGQRERGNRIEFQGDIRGKQKLLACLRKISESDSTPNEQKLKLKNLLLSQESKAKINSKIIDIVYTFQFLDEDNIEGLQALDPTSLNVIFEEARLHHAAKD